MKSRFSLLSGMWRPVYWSRYRLEKPKSIMYMVFSLGGRPITQLPSWMSRWSTPRWCMNCRRVIWARNGIPEHVGIEDVTHDLNCN